MKILITVQNYYPSMSGVPVVVGHLAEGLVSKGHEVTVATRLLEKTNESEVFNGVNIERFKLDYVKFVGITGERERYISFVKNFNCDVIVNECSQCETTDLLLPILSTLSAKKIFHSHGFSGLQLNAVDTSNGLRHFLGNTYNFFRFKNYYKNQFFPYVKNYDHMIFLSEADGFIKTLESICSVKSTIVGNAADDLFFERSQSEKCEAPEFLPEDIGSYAVSIGYFNRVKNQDFILRAFYQSAKENLKTLVLVGPEETPFLNELRKLKIKLDEKYGKRKVLFLTQIPRDSISLILKNARVYLASSKIEAFSVSLIESMVMGVPFISTDVGNASLLPGGELAYSESEMAQKLDDLLSISNEETYVGLSRKGKAFTLENCTRHKVIEKFEDVLLAVLESR